MKYLFSIALAITGIQINAQRTDSLWAASIEHFSARDYHGVIKDLTDFLMLRPGNSSALRNLGIAELYLGDTEGACKNLTLTSGTNDDNVYNIYCNKSAVIDYLVNYSYPDIKVFSEYGFRPVYTKADTLRGALRPERTCFDVTFYDLRLKIIPKGKKISGSNDIYFTMVKPARRIQIDLFSNLNIIDIIWNNTSLRYTREFNAIFIDFPEELKKDEQQIITVIYEGKPVIAENPPWEGGFVWERDKNNNLWIGVACEHLGASSWWPNKDHFSDKPDSMQITMEVPKGYQAVSNGDLRNIITTGKKSDTFEWFVSYPINNYNATFYIGRYTSFSDSVSAEGATIKLDYNVLNYNTDRAREHFQQTGEIVSFYSDVFGSYPFERDGFGLVESPYEGMEHQSAIAYGNGYGENTSGYNFRNNTYDFIIVHEAAHEWWGNSVTAADMADIWIHEGFATYAECLFMEHRYGYDEYLYEIAQKARLIFNVWPLVQNRNVNENTFAGNDVYHKGAMLLHCLRSTIDNDSLFFDILREFCILNKYKVVTTSDFITFVNNKTHRNYTSFFNKFLYDTGLPVLSYKFKKDGSDIVLDYRWTGVEDGFEMAFGIETGNKESFRLEAGTFWSTYRLKNTEFFNFYNLLKGFSGSPKNSFTYFNTHWER